MCTDKSYQNKLRYKFDNNYHSIIITFYIKNIVLVPDIIDRIECGFYIGKTAPL